MWSWSINVRDRQTEGRTDDMRSQYRTLYRLHYSASRGSKRVPILWNIVWIDRCIGHKWSKMDAQFVWTQYSVWGLYTAARLTLLLVHIHPICFWCAVAAWLIAFHVTLPLRSSGTEAADNITQPLYIIFSVWTLDLCCRAFSRSDFSVLIFRNVLLRMGYGVVTSVWFITLLQFYCWVCHRKWNAILKICQLRAKIWQYMAKACIGLWERGTQFFFIEVDLCFLLM